MEALYFAWTEGALSPEEVQALEQRLQEDQELKEVFEELQALEEHMAGVPTELPDARLAKGFAEALAAEKGETAKSKGPGSSIRMPTWMVAASVSLLLGLGMGWFLGQQNHTQVAELQEDMEMMKELVLLTQMQTKSASERIATVQASSQLPRANDEVIAALISTMKSDPNDNVRLAAAEALANFGSQPQVGMALAASLPEQTDPMLQLALIEILVQMKEKGALDEFQQVANDDKVIEQVRLRAQEGIGQLL